MGECYRRNVTDEASQGPTPQQLAAADLVAVTTWEAIEAAYANGQGPLRSYNAAAKKFPPVTSGYMSKPKVAPTFNLGLGVNATLLRWAWAPSNAEAFALAKSLGCKWFRVDVFWNWSSGAWTSLYLSDGVTLDPSAPGKINALTAEMATYGLKPQYIIGGGLAPTYEPGLSGTMPGNGYNTNYPITPAQLAVAMEWLAPQCPGVHWELFGEPDGFQYGSGVGLDMTPSLYVQMLQLVYPAMKKADPTCTVHLGPVVNVAGDSGGWNWLEACYKAAIAAGIKLSDFFDIFDFHCYPTPQNEPYTASYPTEPTPGLDGSIEMMQAMRASYGDTKPAWLTETGVQWTGTGETPDNTQASQAEFLADPSPAKGWLARLNQMYPSVEVAIIYALGDGGGMYYGLVNADNSPRPVFAALQELFG